MGLSTTTVVAVIFLVTGSINTLAAKWANLLKADGGDGVRTPFRHPFLQVPGFLAFGCFLQY
jgi:hypothetical protein